MVKKEQAQEIEASRVPSATLRPTVEELETILFQPIPVLDHGFIRVVDYMGNDAAVVQAARVSYGRGTKQSKEDKALISYLMRHSHTTPFEMAEIKLHVKLPIFVARQWIRHRTASVNEYSARYSILDKEFYLPSPENLAAQSKSNRQGRDEILHAHDAAKVLDLLKSDAEHVYKHYLELLGGKSATGQEHSLGLSRELARMNLSLNFYTQWYWKIDLHNLMSFLRLRADAHAQYEIRAYADVMLMILKRWVPWTYEAFLEHRMNAVHLSASAFDAVKRMLAGQQVTQKTSGLSTREWTELVSLLGMSET